MGLWQPVVLEVAPGPVLVTYPLVNSVVAADLGSATVQLGATLRNVAAAAARTATGRCSVLTVLIPLRVGLGRGACLVRARRARTQDERAPSTQF